MSHIEIKYHNDVHVKVLCSEPSIAFELRDFFTFDVPNARFHPAYKRKMWDGKIRLYNPASCNLYVGLVDYVLEFCASREYKLTFDEAYKNNQPAVTWSPESTLEYLTSLDLYSKNVKLEPMPHQIKGIQNILNKRRCLLLSPTASGKSLIIYGAVRKLQEELNPDKKILIVVPSISLVLQLFSDFQDYSSHNGWDTENNVHKIYQGQSQKTSKQIVLSTWQSIYKNPISYFDQFECVILDEVHLCDSASYKSIMERLIGCPSRIGLTGTLDGTKTAKVVLEGLTGPILRLAYTKDLIDSNILSKLQIDCITLKYDDQTRKAVKNLKYQEEIEYLVLSEKRNNFLTDLAISTKGNTLVLYQFVEKHGKVLYEMLQKKLAGKSRKVFFVSGQTEAEVRESVRKYVDSTEGGNDAIIVASY